MRILLADDSPTFRQVLARRLTSWGFDVVEAADGEAAWGVFQEENPPQLVILDWEMPGLDGVDLCSRIKASQSGRFTYVILLTSRSCSGDLVHGLRSGADDYLTKPVNQQELEARVLVGRRNVALHAELELVRRRLQEQATRDPLTGMLNRRGFVDFLEQEIGAAGAMSLVMLDVDHFKAVNDRWGHQAGDDVLAGVAERIREALPERARAGRYGGEEFIIGLPGATCEEAAETAERIRQAIAARTFATSAGPVRVTASLGFYSTERGSCVDSSALLHVADEALYRAKGSGRNCVVQAGGPEEIVSRPIDWQPRIVAM